MRLLIAEDNLQLARTMQRGLSENAFAVDIARDGADALYRLSITSYDLVILDLGLPEVHGMEVCRQLRESGSPVLILMLTARDATTDRIAGLNAGADDYLTKPFAFGELLARVRALLRRGTVTAAATLTVADLLVDTVRQRATRAGRDLELTTKEFALLEYFARNPGRVLGRAGLFEHVWNETLDPTSNVIEVYVQRLRRKLGAPPLLRTRRGAGYVLLPGDGADEHGDA
ncbi:MAG TPA: response regulator transcription factor [Thermoanaerobaculia bacterium]|jgi:DNA-binding response OmpR family regulator|nr:response regulator transcription factor [Thermoanaerobaculia bacterium]